MLNYRHIALNAYTGEVICCRTANQLKRRIAYLSRSRKLFGEPVKWVFSHTGYWKPKWRELPYMKG